MSSAPRPGSIPMATTCTATAYRIEVAVSFSPSSSPRNAWTRYSRAPVIKSKRCGVPDTPLEPVIGLAEGETRWRSTTTKNDEAQCPAQHPEFTPLSSEQPVHQPAVQSGGCVRAYRGSRRSGPTARSVRGGRWRGRCADLRGGLHEIREQTARLRVRQRRDRDTLMGRAHEAGPDLDRQPAAGRLPGR